MVFWAGIWALTSHTHLETASLIRRHCMLNWAVTFLIIAIIAAVLGFGGIAGVATEIAKVLFVIFIVLFLISLISGYRMRK
jgi:uncharacterized membrane protein YtjA (UPF0391 family)